jgi:hypothetical protein
MAMRHIMAVVAILHKLALHRHYVAMTMVFAIMVAESSASKSSKQVPHNYYWILRPKVNLCMYNVDANVGLHGFGRRFLSLTTVSFSFANIYFGHIAFTS